MQQELYSFPVSLKIAISAVLFAQTYCTYSRWSSSRKLFLSIIFFFTYLSNTFYLQSSVAYLGVIINNYLSLTLPTDTPHYDNKTISCSGKLSCTLSLAVVIMRVQCMYANIISVIFSLGFFFRGMI